MWTGGADVKQQLIEQVVSEFYRRQEPPPASLERLVREAGAAQPSAAQRPSFRPAASARQFVAGLVAALLLAAVPAYFLGERAGRRTAAEPSPSLAARPADPLPASAPRALEPRLVVARIHADWCPRCPTIAPLYEELLTRYGNEAVMVVTLDITNPQTRRQAMLLAESLGIRDQVGVAYNGNRVRLEPGMIRLIDREQHSVMATLRSVDDRPDFESRLALALPGDDSAGPK